MRSIFNRLAAPLKDKIHAYDPVHDVCQFLADNYVVISENFDDMINAKVVSFSRSVKYYSNFAMHLAILCKYIILMHHGDSATLAMLGESFHVMANIHYISRLCLSILMTMLPILFTMRYFTNQYVAEAIQSVSNHDTTSAFIRIKNRRLSVMLWVMSRLFNNVLALYRYVL